MILVECAWCATVRYAPCSATCKLATYAVAVDEKPAPKPVP